MAENDNSGAPASAEDVVVAIAELLFECRLTLETSIAGLQVLAPKAPEPLKSELGTLLRFVQQGAEAFEALAGKLTEILPLRGQHHQSPAVYATARRAEPAGQSAPLSASDPHQAEGTRQKG